MSQAEAKPRGARRLQTGVRGLLVIVACCGLITWAARSVWETQHPAIAAARGLDSRKASDRTRATRELMAIGVSDPGRAIPPLVAALGDSAAEVRVAAAEALGVIGGEAIMAGSAGDGPNSATAGLIRSLKNREPVVQVAAINALVRIASSRGTAGSIDHNGIIAAFASALGDRDDQVRLVALNALGRCGPLVSADPPSVLVAALEDRSSKVRAAAVKALAGFPCPLDPWLASLLRRLEHEEREVRLACAVVFDRARPPAFSPAAIPALVAALGNRARIVRFSAARALVPHARDPRAAVLISALVALLKEPIDPDPDNQPFGAFYINIGCVRMLTSVAPGTASVGEAVAGLAEAARAGDPSWRQVAIGALGDFGPAAEPAVPVLVQALRDALTREEKFAIEGQAAAGVLAKIAPGTRSAGAVIAALTEVVRSHHPTWRVWAAEDLGAFGAAAEPAIPALIEALHDALAGEDARLSYGFAAARALGRIAPETSAADEALAALTGALESDSEARLGAVSALPAFGSKAAGALPRLRAWKNGSDDRLKWAATSALKAIEGAEAGHQEGDGDGGKGLE
jgi:HEAT repeat protein